MSLECGEAPGTALISGIPALISCAVFQGPSPNVVGATTAVAASTILAMSVDTMILEAFEVAHKFTGLTTLVGFLIGFVPSKTDG